MRRIKQDWVMPSREVAFAKFTDKVAAMAADIKNYHPQAETCARYGISTADYQRGRDVLKINCRQLTDAVDDGLITPGEIDRLRKLDQPTLVAEVEMRVVVRTAKKEDPRSKNGNFNLDAMRSLLHRTYVEWRGVSFNVKIRQNILPQTEEGLRDMYRDASNAGNAVEIVINELRREIERCLQKIAELKTSSPTWELDGSTSTTLSTKT